MSINWLKKTAAILSLCLMLGAVSGCAGNSSSEEGTAEAGTAEASTAQATEEAEPAPKVGFIYNGDCSQPGFSADINDQRIQAMQHTDLETMYIDNVNVSDLEGAVDALVQAGCSTIFTCSPVYTHNVNIIAQKYMNVDFVDYGASMGSTNIYAYTENIFEGAYVCGMAAAYNSETEKIGMVVDPHMLYPTATVNAVTLGAQLVYEDAQVVVASAYRDGEIYSAVKALDAQGCDVIVSYTDSPKTVEYCNDMGIKVIGNLDYSDNSADYENLLMYFCQSRNSFFLSQFKSLALKTWECSNYTGTVSNEVVYISDALPAAKDGTQDIIEKLIPKVANGSAYIFKDELKDVNGSLVQMQGQIMMPAEIYSMSWYVRGVDATSLDSFIDPQLDLAPNDFEIKH